MVLPIASTGLMLIGMAKLFAKLKPKRRWVQFSLRASFVVVTLLCIALGKWVMPAERQRRAVAAIEGMGGRLSYAEPSTALPITFLRRWLPPDYFDKVIVVNLTGTQVTDSELAQLQGMTGLRQLWLTNTQATDAGLVHLKGLTGLQQLWLNNTQVTDSGLAHLKRLTNLEILSLDGDNQVGDAGLAHLKGLTCLQWLILSNTQITDVGLADLKGLTGLKQLTLNTRVTEAGVARLQHVLPKCEIKH